MQYALKFPHILRHIGKRCSSSRISMSQMHETKCQVPRRKLMSHKIKCYMLFLGTEDLDPSEVFLSMMVLLSFFD